MADVKDPQESKGRSGTTAQRIGGPPVILILLLLVVVGGVYLEKYTDTKPSIWLSSIFNSVDAQKTVAGTYSHHFKAVESKTGSGSLDATSSDQTWSYTFNQNGTYDVYLNGSLQYYVSGTWSQAGSMLTLISRGDGQAIASYTSKATVSQDANSITFGGNGDKYTRE